MSSSILRHKLLEIRQLTFKAIYSDESREVLRDLWLEVEEVLSKKAVPAEDRLLLAELSCSHNTVASTMADVETLLIDLMSEAHQELDNGSRCEFRSRTIKKSNSK
jgi:hypothetical protein